MRLLTAPNLVGEGRAMTATGQSRLSIRVASMRRASGLVPFGTYYAYFTAGAETV
jgi:hypothetical protein